MKELILRKKEYENTMVETIYLGGGTPSILSVKELERIIDIIYINYNIDSKIEITIEANPDDLTKDKLKDLCKTRINRLSIGVQSFYDKELMLMNRSHNSKQAIDCINLATKYFDNISVDLIYGIPGLDNTRWIKNIEILLDLKIPHISAYALTIEPKTTLQKLIEMGKINNIDDDLAHDQFLILLDILKKNNYDHYELSNFAIKNYYSLNNSSYWKQKKYIGIGPSAHSFNGNERMWNIRNNSIYIKKIMENKLPIKKEILTKMDKFNETIMIGLRTIWGVDLSYIEKEFGENQKKQLLIKAKNHIDNHLLFLDDNKLLTTRKGKFLSDGIAADLFILK